MTNLTAARRSSNLRNSSLGLIFPPPIESFENHCTNTNCFVIGVYCR